MRSSVIFTLALLTVSAATTTVGAAGFPGTLGRRIDVTVGGGVSMPQNPDLVRTFYNPGFSVMAGAGFSFGENEKHMVFLHGDYVRMSMDEDEYLYALDAPPATTVSGGELNITTITLNYRQNLAQQGDFRPFVSGGLGVGIVKVGTMTFSNEGELIEKESVVDGTDPAITMAAGVETVMYGLRVFGELRYMLVIQRNDKLVTVPLHVGVRF